MMWPSRLKVMLFGKPHDPPPIEQHMAGLRESSERRHAAVGEQAELQRRLFFISLEARADVGLYGSRPENPPADG